MIGALFSLVLSAIAIVLDTSRIAPVLINMDKIEGMRFTELVFKFEPADHRQAFSVLFKSLGKLAPIAIGVCERNVFFVIGRKINIEPPGTSSIAQHFRSEVVSFLPVTRTVHREIVPPQSEFIGWRHSRIPDRNDWLYAHLVARAPILKTRERLARVGYDISAKTSTIRLGLLSERIFGELYLAADFRKLQPAENREGTGGDGKDQGERPVGPSEKHLPAVIFGALLIYTLAVFIALWLFETDTKLVIYFGSWPILAWGVSLAMWYSGQWLGVVGICVAVASATISALTLNRIINSWLG